MSNINLDHGTVGFAEDAPHAVTTSKYCYMLPHLARAEAARGEEKDRASFAMLNSLAAAMDHVASAFETARPSRLPAIYTYFGQFLNHDISAPAGTPGFRSLTKMSIDKIEDRALIEPSVIENNPDLVALMSVQRAPSSELVVKSLINLHPLPMQLNSLYGGGPAEQRAGGKPIYAADGMKFALARVSPVENMTDAERRSFAARGALPFDLQRDTKIGITFIADRRNDENLILSQLHLALMLFHNRVVDVLRPRCATPEQTFAAARDLVRWHYQWCILKDYLPKIAPHAPSAPKGFLIEPGKVPLEFTSAAFRFGHSMVSKRYNYNEIFSTGGREGPATLTQLFNFTSPGGMGMDPLDFPRTVPPEQLPETWVIDWRRFIAVGPQATAADKIDPVISAEMSSLPGRIPDMKVDAGLKAIAYRNLRRGYHRFIASGQELAKALGIPRLEKTELQSIFMGDGDYRPGISGLGPELVADNSELFERTPAWFYFLCEARLRSDGQALGPTAGAIVAETLLGLLLADRSSMLHAEHGEWTPSASPLKLANGAPIDDIASMLKYAGVLA